MLLSKNRIIRRRAVVGLLLAASLTLLTLSFREGSSGVVGEIQRNAVSVTAPFATVAHRVTRPAVDAWNWASGLASARDSTEQLKRLQAQFGKLQVIQNQQAEEVARLKALLHFKSTLGQTKSVAGQVLEQSPTAYQNTVTIDIGSSAGVAVNDPVVAPTKESGALIGKVVQVTGDQAVVTLLLDPQNYVTAGVQGEPNAVGLIKAASGQVGILSLELIPNAVRVQEGDIVTTAGFKSSRLASYYPPGIPIGRVTSVSGNDTTGDTKVIQVTPFADFQNITDVLVLEPRR
ncbi:MAG TPA: rod shape-determining protein MreC [Gaiellales bacterium]|jgi:rod shape-determining protein MreC|nr:rod shape-determining protein MreC [Gaiellales bacterium]